jgi:3-hydroxyisobutyrate dehydrogenase
MRIGWIGTGVMGSAMASHLLDAGHELTVHNRTRAKAAALEAAGARWAELPAEVAVGAEIVGLMVGTPQDVDDLVLGPGGLLAAMEPGSILIDFTTSSPALAQRIAREATRREVASLDAPVSGGDVGARAATLSIMVGGSLESFERARQVLETLGATVVLQGGPGAGQHTKMVNQILVAGTMMGLAEALVYAVNHSLRPDRVLESVSGGAAASWALTNLAPRALSGDLEPGFAVEHLVKDLTIALDAASQAALDLPATRLARQLYDSLAGHGASKRGTQALVVEISRRSGQDWDPPR